MSEFLFRQHVKRDQIEQHRGDEGRGGDQQRSSVRTSQRQQGEAAPRSRRSLHTLLWIAVLPISNAVSALRRG